MAYLRRRTRNFQGWTPLDNLRFNLAWTKEKQMAALRIGQRHV